MSTDSWKQFQKEVSEASTGLLSSLLTHRTSLLQGLRDQKEEAYKAYSSALDDYIKLQKEFEIMEEELRKRKQESK